FDVTCSCLIALRPWHKMARTKRPISAKTRRTVTAVRGPSPRQGACLGAGDSIREPRPLVGATRRRTEHESSGPSFRRGLDRASRPGRATDLAGAWLLPNAGDRAPADSPRESGRRAGYQAGRATRCSRREAGLQGRGWKPDRLSAAEARDEARRSRRGAEPEVGSDRPAEPAEPAEPVGSRAPIPV